ncbi:hypothetical protein IDSA_08870 [Pseudidiomarina salinarum]|uniref:Putative mRNA interferase YoeB n=1 Tax=Pseudidiomarina salinarum TaxID=435908 RepID=A0A094IXS1_9GAMM|nr:hypothetical protein IDSA_08870 [Pseudidiomarina salinarum]
MSGTAIAWDDYLSWQNDPVKRRAIDALIRACMRTPFAGIGKPEPLQGSLSGFWSRRIDRKHRLVYHFEEGYLTILQCRYHDQK